VFRNASCQLVSRVPVLLFRAFSLTRFFTMAWSGFGTIAPDASRPSVTLTFVPSSRNRIPMRVAAPVTGSTMPTLL